MTRFASHSAFVLLLVLAATGCSAAAGTAAVQSPAKRTAATCDAEARDAQAERDCLRRVLSDLAGLDSHEGGETRLTASATSRTQTR